MRTKVKKIVVLVPLKVVDRCVPFRFNGNWWKRKIGVANWAVSTTNQEDHRQIEEKSIVAIHKKDLKISHYHQIVAELKDFKKKP